MKEKLIDLVKQEVKEKYGEEYKVINKFVLKNNGLKLDAILICDKNTRTVPTIYINELLEEIEECRITVEDAAKEIIKAYEEAKRAEFNLRDMKSLVGNVYIQVINKEKNEERLKTLVHREYKDLAVVYRAVVERTDTGTASTMITNEILDAMGVSEEELHRIAVENANKDKFTPIPMKTILTRLLREKMGEFVDEEFVNLVIDPLEMYVVGYEATFGSACLYTHNGIKELADKLEKDLYILPSSIHEVILVPKIEDIEVKDLKDMVPEVNTNNVPDDEILSDNVYYYDRAKDTIEML